MLLDLHVHTARHSPCAQYLDPVRLDEAPNLGGLGGIVLTEHDKLWTKREWVSLQRKVGRLRIYRGIEISAREGHFLAIGLTTTRGLGPGVPASVLIDRVHRVGGTVQTENVPDGLDAVEVMSSVMITGQRGWIETIISGEAPHAQHSPYRMEYDWLFHLERRLARFLDPWLKSYRSQLIGSRGLLCEALSNAYCHGNCRNQYAAIVVEAYVGRHGIVVMIEDEGAGFDLESTCDRLSAGYRHAHHIAGQGMRSMHLSDQFGVFYDKGGKRFGLLHMSDGPDRMAGWVWKPAFASA